MSESHVTVKLSLSLLPDGRCRARIDDSPAGASRGTGNDFSLPLRPANGGYPKFLKECGAGTRPADDLRDLGQKLYSDVFTGTVSNAFDRARSLAESRQAFLRLAISAQSPELLELPWEYLHSETGYLLQQAKTHVVRVIDELPQQMAPFRPFTRLLVAVANPADKGRFDADAHLERIRTILESMGAGVVKVIGTTYDALLTAIENEEFDAFYFLGHGQLNTETGGEIFLEDGLKSAPMPATVLAQRLSWAKKRVYFAYFNSCCTGTADAASTFAGVAQRILADGRVPAVLAQQAPVKANESMKIAEAVLRRIREGQSPEVAVVFARSEARGTNWGIPVLYTHLHGPEEFERNRIACLLGAEIDESKHGIVLPSFGMGVHLDGHRKMASLKPGKYQLPDISNPITVTVDPPDTYVYPGETHACDDVAAAGDVQKLLMRIARSEHIGFYPSTQDGTDITHWFLFGSRSNKLVATYLKRYSPRFAFDYGEDEWTLVELNACKKVIERHKISAPHRLAQRAYDDTDDFGIIEKITDQEHQRIFFIIAGLGSRATRGCGWYLGRHWDELLKKADGSDFGAVIKCPASLPHTDATLLRVRVEA